MSSTAMSERKQRYAIFETVNRDIYHNMQSHNFCNHTLPATMQFIVNARIPILNGLLTGENQSLLIEALFLTMVFLIYANLFSSLLQSISEHLP
jgi:hypothetical protein